MTETTSIYKLLKPLGSAKGLKPLGNTNNTCISKWFPLNHQHIQTTATSMDSLYSWKHRELGNTMYLILKVKSVVIWS